MPFPITGSLVDLLQLSTISPKKPPRPQRKQRGTFHRWTDEELNLITYLRLHRNWSWVQIQRTFFSSKSAAAVRLAYTHIPTEERMHRATAALSLPVNPTNIVGEGSGIRNRTPISTPSSKQGRSHSIPAASSSVQTGNDIELVALTASSSEDECTTFTNNSITSRYKLRPNRPKSFKENSSPCLVDRSRFPHFCQAYKTHWKQHTAPDTDYYPPSQSPTPELNDRSPSVALSLLSNASSLELFGLEVRPVNPPDPGLSIIPSSPGDEFLSAEEYPASP
ncbi:hypothetical protein B0T10DRAFT_414208 [Thelonectria olida]|uniref:Uncharacterized protein n=1 Tax=Thelonectria olida TaxID=1576542 RepID=A0A9P8VT99_9HYPO|nr:hypothetical protein B0T10DRAFT_414208 [Thelonectria olida]